MTAGIAVAVSGFVAILLGWRGATATDDVQSQFAYLVSGGFGGLALVVLGSVLVAIDGRRREAKATLDAVADLVEAVRRRG